ncbi:MAG: GtrA family protein [Polaromonas sp.]|nr:GtrA family protein [Polaromonas sp.]
MSAAAKSGFWFLAVGASAALTHVGVFALTQRHLWPEIANASGFGVAFFVSFAGHRLLSFRDAGTSVKQSMQRFAVTALAGFLTNELMFVLLLRLAHWYAFWALLTALLLAAVQTFLLSRFWAFRR